MTHVMERVMDIAASKGINITVVGHVTKEELFIAMCRAKVFPACMCLFPGGQMSFVCSGIVLKIKVVSLDIAATDKWGIDCRAWL